MPNFQSGEIQALQRVVTELRDQIGRARGTSSADKALESGSRLPQQSRRTSGTSISAVPGRR